jgi:hypothetical protein
MTVASLYRFACAAAQRCPSHTMTVSGRMKGETISAPSRLSLLNSPEGSATMWTGRTI